MGSCFSSEKGRSAAETGGGGALENNGRAAAAGGATTTTGNYNDKSHSSAGNDNQNYMNVPIELRLNDGSYNNDGARSQSRQTSSTVVAGGNGSNSDTNGATSQSNMQRQTSVTSNSSSSRQEIKILLLGSGESGKSTILKQMKIIHQNGYSQEELLMYKTTVYKNLLDCSKAIVAALEAFELSVSAPPSPVVDGEEDNEVVEAPTTPTSEATAAMADQLVKSTNSPATSAYTNGGGPVPPLTNTSAAITPQGSVSSATLVPLTKEDLELIKNCYIPPDPDFVLPAEITRVISTLWAHPVVRRMFAERRSEFYIMDSAPYFFANVHRIGHQDYIPNVADILRARIKTTGIYETQFDMGGMNIHMYDVGGQRSERKKWIHCFDNVTLIIFCVALSEYDQVLLEEKHQNRMAESLVLFDSVINSRWFMRTSVVLFLNKIDVFTDKLPHSPLENYFPDYTGGNDINKAAKYILWRFTQLNRAGLNIYPHLTQATDTSNIRLVFAAVKETILQNALRDSGIL